MSRRTLLKTFHLGNPLYIGSLMTAWAIDANGAKTATMITLYANETGTDPSDQLGNPQTLDSYGKLEQPTYYDEPFIATVTGVNIADYDTGVIYTTGTWRQTWLTATVYYPNDFVADPSNLNDIYVVMGRHTSGTFATDVTNGLLEIMIDSNNGLTPLTTNQSALLFAGATNWKETLPAEATWDDTNKRLGLNVATPAEMFSLDDGSILIRPGTAAIPGTPPVVGNIDDATTYNSITDLVIVGNYIYSVNGSSDSMAITDISDPTNPVEVSYLLDGTNLNFCDWIETDGRFLYILALNANAIQVVDIQDPTTPVLRGSLVSAPRFVTIRSAALSGQYLYVMDSGGDTIEVVDISDPDAPVFAAQLTGTAYNATTRCVVERSILYSVSTDDTSLQITDVSDPQNPVSLGELVDATNFANIKHISVVGRYAYIGANLTSHDTSLVIVDVSDPTTPVFVSATDLTVVSESQDMVQIEAAGNYVYALTFAEGLHIFDVTDRTAPVLVATQTALFSPGCFVIQGKYMYVGSTSPDGINVVELPGIKAPTAQVGRMAVGWLDVISDLIIGNKLMVAGGANFGSDVHVGGRLTGPRVVGYVGGSVVSVESDLGGETTTFVPTTEIAASTWESVGPTGSGATNIWVGMDNIPAHARVVLVKVISVTQGATLSDTYTVTTYARVTGSSTGTVFGGQIGKASFINQVASSGGVQAQSFAPVPLDSSLRFDVQWVPVGTTPTSVVTMVLSGYI